MTEIKNLCEPLRMSRLSLKQVAVSRWPAAIKITNEELELRKVVNKERLEKFFQDHGLTEDQWTLRSCSENCLDDFSVLDTFFKNMWVLGWTGFAKPVVDFVKQAEGHGDFPQSLFTTVAKSPGHHSQRRVAAFMSLDSYRECKAILKSLGGSCLDVDSDLVEVKRFR